MPQTIQIQRGASTLANNSITTLFTQSGGLGTRVIFNMLTFYGSGQMGSPTLNICRVSSTGGGSLVAYFKGGGTFWTGQFIPSSDAIGPAMGLSGSSATVGGTLSADTGSSNYINTFTPNFVSIISGNSGWGSYAPSNFWLGPSDSVTLGFSDNNSRTLTFAYSFTTITES